MPDSSFPRFRSPRTLNRIWMDFEDSFPRNGLVWGADPDEWKRRTIATFEYLCEGPDSAHAEGVGSGRFLFDLVWSIGDPRTAAFCYFSLALECVLPWSARDWPEWRAEVQRHFNRLHAANSDWKILVAAAPVFTRGRDVAQSALATLHRCLTVFTGIHTETLVVLFSAPESEHETCAIRAMLFHVTASAPALFGPPARPDDADEDGPAATEPWKS